MYDVAGTTKSKTKSPRRRQGGHTVDGQPSESCREPLPIGAASQLDKRAVTEYGGRGGAAQTIDQATTGIRSLSSSVSRRPDHDSRQTHSKSKCLECGVH